MIDIWMLSEHVGGFGTMELESGFRNPCLDGGTGIWVVGWFLPGCVLWNWTRYMWTVDAPIGQTTARGGGEDGIRELTREVRGLHRRPTGVMPMLQLLQQS